MSICYKSANNFFTLSINLIAIRGPFFIDKASFVHHFVSSILLHIADPFNLLLDALVNPTTNSSQGLNVSVCLRCQCLELLSPSPSFLHHCCIYLVDDARYILVPNLQGEKKRAYLPISLLSYESSRSTRAIRWLNKRPTKVCCRQPKSDLD